MRRRQLISRLVTVVVVVVFMVAVIGLGLTRLPLLHHINLVALPTPTATSTPAPTATPTADQPIVQAPTATPAPTRAPTPTATPLPDNAAWFVGSDSTTQGTWKGMYGADGYDVICDGGSCNIGAYPSYAQVTASGKANYIWSGSTADPRALQRAANPAQRIAACWYSGGTFTIDLTISDGQTHRLALYFLDWDGYGAGGRVETVSISDAAGNPLDQPHQLAKFRDGVYLVWRVRGHVSIQITNNNSNAVVSGLFFDPAT